jgi:lipopolysaccharide export system protein LptA
VFYQNSPEASSLPGEKSQKSPLPITITSEKASYSAQINTARFLHNVKVNRNDAELSAQKLDVFLEKEMGKIEKIVASDQVKISQKDKEISADHGIFFEKEKKVVLTGNPISRQGENVLSGKEIVYYFDSETVEVKKARTILHPRGMEGKSFLLPASGM